MSQDQIAEKQFNLLSKLIERQRQSSDGILHDKAIEQFKRLKQQYPEYVKENSDLISSMEISLGVGIADHKTGKIPLLETTFNGQTIYTGRKITDKDNKTYTLKSIFKYNDDVYLEMADEYINYYIKKDEFANMDEGTSIAKFLRNNDYSHKLEEEWEEKARQQANTPIVIKNIPKAPYANKPAEPQEETKVSVKPSIKKEGLDALADIVSAYMKDGPTPPNETPTPEPIQKEDSMEAFLNEVFTKNNNTYPDWEALKQFDPNEEYTLATESGNKKIKLNAEYFLNPEKFGVAISPIYKKFHTKLVKLKNKKNIEPKPNQSIADYIEELLK